MRYTCLLFASCLFFINCLRAAPAPQHTVIATTIDSIVIVKHFHQLTAFSNHRAVKTFHVCLGPQPVGKKHFRNDGKTPEGHYFINGKNPGSHYHKCLGVSYPDNADRAYARAQGRDTGGDIKIHGLPNDYEGSDDDHIETDWTLGCIALSNTEIDELYAHVDVGTPVLISP